MRQLREQRANTRPPLHVADPGTVTAGCPLGFNTEQGMQHHPLFTNIKPPFSNVKP